MVCVIEWFTHTITSKIQCEVCEVSLFTHIKYRKNEIYMCVTNHITHIFLNLRPSLSAHIVEPGRSLILYLFAMDRIGDVILQSGSSL